MTPNPNTQSSLSPADLMFGKRARSIYDKLLPGHKMFGKTQNKRQTDILSLEIKIYIYICIFLVKKCGKMVLFIINRLGKNTFMIQGPNWRHKKKEP